MRMHPPAPNWFSEPQVGDCITRRRLIRMSGDTGRQQRSTSILEQIQMLESTSENIYTVKTSLLSTLSFMFISQLTNLVKSFFSLWKHSSRIHVSTTMYVLWLRIWGSKHMHASKYQPLPRESEKSQLSLLACITTCYLSLHFKWRSSFFALGLVKSRVERYIGKNRLTCTLFSKICKKKGTSIFNLAHWIEIN